MKKVKCQFCKTEQLNESATEDLQQQLNDKGQCSHCGKTIKTNIVSVVMILAGVLFTLIGNPLAGKYIGIPPTAGLFLCLVGGIAVYVATMKIGLHTVSDT